MTDKKDVCNEEIFQSIFNTNYKPLMNYLYYKYGDWEKSKDIMQDSFIKLWDKCKEVPYDKAKGYVFVSAKNAYLNYIKRQQMISRHHDGLNRNILYAQSPDHCLEEKQFLEKINRIISSLPSQHRQIFLMNRIDEKTYKEIAAVLEISVKTVEKKMHDTLKIVREKIGNI
ncbi:RNA polymerase sigma factor [Aquimarina sp. RZ0]|uniref:RNA polymerase sigma factor n=1 Tax=Aquimarina sp. RZ0 TaxID=2607730 RepID=UPI0011F395B2|nr:RNA polymerase sigma-70 factor [Aquimarina sp. RZ0]KAA1243044.1 RNA polymerase sigma-70 factor [Aquimarina sp. RZ0]